MIIAIDLAYRKPLCLAIFSNHGNLYEVREIGPEQDVYSTVSLLMDYLKNNPKRTLVVVETPLMLKNMNVAYTMARLHGMIEKGVRDAGYLFFGIHPRTWQSALLEQGKDTKEESIRVAAEFTGKPISNNDHADAINIGRYCALRRRDIMKAISGGQRFNEKAPCKRKRG